VVGPELSLAPLRGGYSYYDGGGYGYYMHGGGYVSDYGYGHGYGYGQSTNGESDYDGDEPTSPGVTIVISQSF